MRRNDGGTLRTATYTAAVAHLTAVERKPFYHVRPGAQVLTVAGPGCSFRCDYCINYRLSQYGRDDDAAVARRARAAGRARGAGGRRAGALLGMSYTEPSLAPELTLDLASHGVPVVWKSNGYLTAGGDLGPRARAAGGEHRRQGGGRGGAPAPHRRVARAGVARRSRYSTRPACGWR